MVSPRALSSGPAAGRDQTWAVFGKGHGQPGGMCQRESKSLQFGFQVLRVLKTGQPGFSGDSPCLEMFMLTAGLLLQMTVSMATGLKNPSFKLHLPHVIICSVFLQDTFFFS